MLLTIAELPSNISTMVYVWDWRDTSIFSTYWYWVTHKLPQLYTANHATFQIRLRKITVQICGNLLVIQYYVVLVTCRPHLISQFRYCLSKKSRPNLCSNLLYQMGQAFWDTQYWEHRFWYRFQGFLKYVTLHYITYEDEIKAFWTSF